MDKSTIAKLDAAPLEICGRVPAPWGLENIFLKADELEAFCKDPEGFAALKYGVTKEEYLKWVETGGAPRCGAKTSKGKRCRNLVSGGIQISLERWLREEGGYCTVHGGLSGAEARLNS